MAVRMGKLADLTGKQFERLTVLERVKKTNSSGIKTEAVGRFYVHGERTCALSKRISEKAEHFNILYKYDYDVNKMVTLANEIKEIAEALVLATQAIADSTPKEVDE